MTEDFKEFCVGNFAKSHYQIRLEVASNLFSTGSTGLNAFQCWSNADSFMEEMERRFEAEAKEYAEKNAKLAENFRAGLRGFPFGG